MTWNFTGRQILIFDPFSIYPDQCVLQLCLPLLPVAVFMLLYHAVCYSLIVVARGFRKKVEGLFLLRI
jgi:hypothetical protein